MDWLKKFWPQSSAQLDLVPEGHEFEAVDVNVPKFDLADQYSYMNGKCYSMLTKGFVPDSFCEAFGKKKAIVSATPAIRPQGVSGPVKFILIGGALFAAYYLLKKK